MSPRIHANLKRNRAGRGFTLGGFTLVELLVVVSIIAMLVALVLPSLGGAMESSRRGTCRANVKALADACRFYAMDKQEHRPVPTNTPPYLGMPQTALPSVAGVTAWSANGTGNRKCLWMLLKNNLLSPNVFVCPSLDSAVAPKVADNSFNANTCSYSYQSMVTPPPLTMDAPPTTVIFADASPRAASGSLMSDANFNPALHNSKSHKSGGGTYDGQNAGHLDGSVEWLTVPKTGAYNDWIYQADGTGGVDGSGTPGTLDGSIETFLQP